MSLEATHIRFAVDQKDKYNIKDLGLYILGSIYPDSRYISKIDRKLTHNKHALSDSFLTDDFKKGWQSHCIFDNEYSKMVKELFPELFVNISDADEWIISTAIKIVADIFDMRSFNIQSFLPYLDDTRNPNNEDIDKIHQYNQLIKNAYEDNVSLTVDDYVVILKEFGIDPVISEKTIIKAGEFFNNKDISAKIKNLYGFISAEFDNTPCIP